MTDRSIAFTVHQELASRGLKQMNTIDCAAKAMCSNVGDGKMRVMVRVSLGRAVLKRLGASLSLFRPTARTATPYRAELSADLPFLSQWLGWRRAA